MVENPPANAGDAGNTGLLPELGRSPGGGSGYPLQPTPVPLPGKSHRGAWQATAHGVARESDTA